MINYNNHSYSYQECNNFDIDLYSEFISVSPSSGMTTLRTDSDDNIIVLDSYRKTKTIHCDLNQHTLQIYTLEKNNLNKEASTYITALMHFSVYDNDVNFLDNFFKVINKKELSSWSLIALLRSTSVYKKNIGLWKEFYLHTRQVLIDENLNPDQEMYGLNRGLSINI